MARGKAVREAIKAPEPPAPEAKPSKAQIPMIQRFAERAGFSLMNVLFIDVRGHNYVALVTEPGGGQKRYEMSAEHFKSSMYDAAVEHLGISMDEVSGFGHCSAEVQVRLKDGTFKNVSRADIGV